MGLVISKEINLFLTVPETGKSEVKVPAGLVSAESLFDHFQYALNMGCLPSPREEEFCFHIAEFPRREWPVPVDPFVVAFMGAESSGL